MNNGFVATPRGRYFLRWLMLWPPVEDGRRGFGGAGPEFVLDDSVDGLWMHAVTTPQFRFRKPRSKLFTDLLSLFHVELGPAVLYRCLAPLLNLCLHIA